jgi:hypothetical protein
LSAQRGATKKHKPEKDATAVHLRARGVDFAHVLNRLVGVGLRNENKQQGASLHDISLQLVLRGGLKVFSPAWSIATGR